MGHMGHQFECMYFPMRLKTNNGKKKHEKKACPANREQAGTDHGEDNPASDPKSGESSIEDMVIE